MSNSTTTPLFDQLVDYNGTLYSVYDLSDKLVECTTDRDRAEALVQRIKTGKPLRFTEDGVR